MTAADQALRQHFPSVYLTLISILIALAIETLLGKLAGFEGLFVWSGARAVVWGQAGLILLIAALYWWVAVRWVCSIPWPFSFFDTVGSFGLLVALHFLVTFVGSQSGDWFVALGLMSLASWGFYFINTLRAAVATGRDLARVTRETAKPVAIGFAVGLPLVVVGGMTVGGSLSAGVIVTLNLIVFAVIVGSMPLEYRAWRSVLALPEGD